MMQGPDSTRPEVDPMVLDAVKMVRDRFGAIGLRHLVTLAKDELARVEQAEVHLAAAIDQTGQNDDAVGGGLDAADTQAWLAFTEQGPEPFDENSR